MQSIESFCKEKEASLDEQKYEEFKNDPRRKLIMDEIREIVHMKQVLN